MAATSPWPWAGCHGAFNGTGGLVEVQGDLSFKGLQFVADSYALAACIFPPRDLIALKPQFAQLRRGFQNTRSARTPGLRLVEGLSLVERSKAACCANAVN